MSRNYDQIFEGQWTPWANGKGNRLQCCHCSLVHTIQFRFRNGEVETRMFIDNRSTAALRRANGIKVVTKKKPKPKTL